MNTSTLTSTVTSTVNTALDNVRALAAKLPQLDGVTQELRKLDLPRIDLPRIDLPKFDLPRLDLTGFELPDVPVDAARVTGLARDAAYLSIGAMVVTVQAAEARGREIADQLTAQARKGLAARG